MRLCWVVAGASEAYAPDKLQKIKSLGPIWGSWKTWRTWRTDNCVCHNDATAHKLLQKNFQQVANLFVPSSVHKTLPPSANVLAYAGNLEHAFDNIEDLVAMHIAAEHSDLVLLIGFDFGLQKKFSKEYYGMLRGTIISHDVQWLAIDQDKFADPFSSLSNLTSDKLDKVLQYLMSLQVDNNE